ncbi:hypothetical protein FA95DRAFT_1557309 [Auriscalpium vulgare]|uniref:Uncharacterized protein n=1 Tax=Auriscalpium vulgare TaxID=40419 RepID=A0ACB8RY93_9AGAM|nr:hypothetical protein FA95DRAFT_1557309 [Auriscalpium vulgare]
MSDDTAPLPALPTLSGEVLFETFSHRDLSSGALNDDFGNADRLSALGASALALVVTQALFDRRPMLSADDLPNAAEEKMSDETLDEWVTKYDLREKVQCAPDVRDSLSEPGETRNLFTTYVGAVYHQRGLRAVQEWIGRLIDPDYAPAPSQSAQPATGGQQPFSANTPPPPNNPPPPPASPIHAPILPIFNQRCSQNGIAVVWPTASTGPPHAPSWTADCQIDGHTIATGAGATKQLAKEDAAKHAYRALWPNGGF